MVHAHIHSTVYEPAADDRCKPFTAALACQQLAALQQLCDQAGALSECYCSLQLLELPQHTCQCYNISTRAHVVVCTTVQLEQSAQATNMKQLLMQNATALVLLLHQHACYDVEQTRAFRAYTDAHILLCTAVSNTKKHCVQGAVAIGCATYLV
jgi:hypothetical protein